MGSNSKFTRDNADNVAVRVVASTEALPATEKDSMFTKDINGNTAVRTVGSIDKTAMRNIIIKSNVIPDASAEELGNMYIYAGTTNSTYTHGYIYECVGSNIEYDGVIGFDPGKIAFDYTKGTLADFFEDNHINSYWEVVVGSMTYLADGDIWAIEGRDSLGNTVFTGLQLYTQDLVDAGFVFINPPQDYADEEVIEYFTGWTAEGSFAWQRINVQP